MTNGRKPGIHAGILPQLGILTACDKTLAGFDKSPTPAGDILHRMRKSEPSKMSDRNNADFAVVGVFEGQIFLEANEWDASRGHFQVVTLYLEPGHALDVAEQLFSCAAVLAGNPGTPA
jgi:hypothetical protein